MTKQTALESPKTKKALNEIKWAKISSDIAAKINVHKCYCG